jgi:BioD-like phosphotransacetylase family protein
VADIVLKMNIKTARKLSYAIGHSDEANAVVYAATNAAKVAEQNVRDIINLIADAQGIKLPYHYGVVFNEDENEIKLTTQTDNMVGQEFSPTNLRVNGIN